MPANPRRFCCPECRRTVVTEVKRNLCTRCYRQTLKRLFCCPACGETRVTGVRKGLCFRCYQRTRPPREHKTMGRCNGCAQVRVAFYRQGLCPGCYERERRQCFTCPACQRQVEAPANFAAMRVCPRCWSRSRVVEAFTCPACRVTKRTRPQAGVCRRCYERGRRWVAFCPGCQQDREMDSGRHSLCRACRQERERRSKGIPAIEREPQEALEGRLLNMLAPLRSAWVADFLVTRYRRRTPKTREELLRALVKFDGHLTRESNVGHGQWSLVSPDHVEAYLASVGRLQLEPAKQFFKWLRSRKGTVHDLASWLPRRPHAPRLRLLTFEQVWSLYGRWTSDISEPREALVGLLALVHCLTNSQIRQLRLADVHAPDRLLVARRSLTLAPPVEKAVVRYLAWRARSYKGPSRYLIVNAAGRTKDQPVGETWFQYWLLGGISVASLRQTAINQLVQHVGCDELQLAAFTGLSLGSVALYTRLFGSPR